jgi:hypothetical protein
MNIFWMNYEKQNIFQEIGQIWVLVTIQLVLI